MASEKDATTCANDPNFAIICAFFQKFSVILNVPQPDIKLLQSWLENTDEVPSGLKELHIKLLRKLRKTVHINAWETALVKFCHTYSQQDAWEIERFGYKKSSLKVKLRILKEILEGQFERNTKFRSGISSLSAADLREEPIGRDKLGHAYWLTQDLQCNLRIYQEHLDEEIWQVVASNREELVALINRLKGNEVVLPSLVGVVDEDSSSNSCPVAILKPPPPEERDESQEEKSQVHMEEKVPNIKIKLDSCTIEKSEENNVAIKSEKIEIEAVADGESEDENGGEDEETSDECAEEEDESEDGGEQDKKEKPNTKTVEKATEKNVSKNEIDGPNAERKVKSIVISPVKRAVITEDRVKKRLLEINDVKEKISDNAAKKARPTLLDVNRKKNVSKYEQLNTEEEGEDECQDEEGEEEESEEEEEEEEEEGEEEDEEEGEEEQEDVEEKVAQKDLHVKDQESKTTEKEPEVGEAIEEDVQVVKGEGSGMDCDASFLAFADVGCEQFEIIGEEIQEETLYVFGEGWGLDCLVGNAKEETENKSILYFSQPGCIKLSPVKKKDDVLLNETPKESDTDNKETHGENELRNGDANATDDNFKEAHKSLNSDAHDQAEDLSKSKQSVTMNTAENCTDSLKNLDRGRKDLSVEENSIENIPANVKNDGEPLEIVSSPEESEKNASAVVSEVSEDAKESKCLNDDENEISQSTCGTLDDGRSGATRKRRLSEDKCQKFIVSSDSDSDCNSEIAEADPDESQIGGKRFKTRPKSTNVDVRKKVEEQRNNEKGTSSSDEQTSKKEPEQQTKVVASSNEVENNQHSQIKDESEGNTEVSVSLDASIDDMKNSPVLIETEEFKKVTDELIEEFSTVPVSGNRAWRGRRGRRRGRIGKTFVGSRLSQLNSNEALDAEIKVTPNKTKDEIISKTVETKKEEDDKNVKAEKLPIKSEKSQDEGEEEGEIVLQIEVKPSPPKKNSRRTKEIDVTNIIDVDADAAPVRQSRRIAQLKMKEEAERRRLEEIALKKMKADLNKKKREEKKCQEEEEEEVVVPSENNSESDTETKKKLEKKKKGKKKGGWSSGSDEEDEEEEYEYEPEFEPGSPLFRSDHEFSPESDIGDDSQGVPLKRARTAKKESDGSDVENVGWCEKCGKRDHPEWILLCDRCDKGYHCSCLIPVLFLIPEGDWYCPPCEQEQLIESLAQHLKIYDEKVRKKELEDKLRQESLEMAKRQAAIDAAAAEEAQNAKRKGSGTKKRSSTKGRRNKEDDDDETDDDDGDEDDVDSTAVNSSASSSHSRSSSSSSSSSATDSDDEPIYKLRKRRQVNLDYRFNEYDDLINSAIKKEMDEVAGAGNLGRGKDISTIIEADKEEKLRKKQLEAKLESERALKIKVEPVDVKVEEPDQVCKQEVEQKEIKQEPKEIVEAKEDSGSDFEPGQRKLKVINRMKNRKKNRKLNSLDTSSEEDESDEDFKTSSYETDEDEDEEVSEATDSESSLSLYRAKKKKDKRNKKSRPVRRARERRKRYDDFIVDDSDLSVDSPKIKKKRKVDSDYSESLTEEELSEDVDSEDLCEDSTDSDESDHAWKPGKRRKQNSPIKQKPPSKSKSFGEKKKQKNKRRDVDEGEKSFKGKFSKKKHETDEDSCDSTRRTRGKRFTYLEDFEDESSEDGIKPGVKRPDTPPEEREEFIRKQEAIKRMLAERNAEAAKAVATPKINPIAKPEESLSTVPPSVIRGAKVLDMDYLARKGELESDPETEFDDDLPDDFNPEDMDEEEIAKMMEEEDFAQHQLKLAGEVIRQKKIKESEVELPKIPKPVGIAPAVVSSESPKKRLAMPIMQTLLVNPPAAKSVTAVSPSQMILPSMNPIQPPHTEPLIPTTVLSVQENNSTLPKAAPDIPANSQTAPITQTQTVTTDKSQMLDTSKPRGRRKKITPLRDTLQKQQTAAAAAAAQAAAAAAAAAVAPLAAAAGAVVPDAPVAPSAPAATTVNKPASNDSGLPEKVSVITAPSLSIAQPPQLYKPASTPPSVITRLPQPPRPRFADPALAARFYSSPNQLLHRPPIRHGGINLSPHLTLRPSYANGPPPLRSANPTTPVSIGNGIARHPPPRSPFGSAEQFPGRGAPHPPYRPPLYGAPGYPPAPPTSSQPPAAHHSVPFTNYFAPPIGSTHSTPPPPVPTPIRNAVSLIASTPPSVQPPPIRPLPATSEMEPIPPVSRPNATALETFNTKSTPPPLQPETAESPYASNLSPEGEEDEPPPPSSAPTSEFSGLVSYFSSQQDDLNT